MLKRGSPYAIRALKVLGPIALAAFYGFLLYVSLPWETLKIVGGGMLIYFVPPAGKESVIPAMVALGVHPMFAALNIAIVDIFGALWLTWNFDLFERIPGIGWVISKIESKAFKTIQANPWMDELAFLGLVVFVIVPFQGSGAVGASILGNIIGMKPEKVLLAVEIGAILGTLAIAYLSSVVLTLIYMNVMYGVAVFLIIAAIILILRQRTRSRTADRISRGRRGSRESGLRRAPADARGGGETRQTLAGRRRP